MKSKIQYFQFVFIILFIWKSTAVLACEKADAAYNRLLFSVAIDEYEKCIKSGKEILSLEKLANAYKILGNSKQSLKTYYRIENRDNMSIASKIEFAYLLRALENKDAALTWLETCLTTHSGHPQLLNMKNVFEKEIIFDENQSYLIESAPFNSPQSDYSPALYKNSIVFSSTRMMNKEIDGYTSQNYSRLFYYDSNRQKILPFANEIAGLYNIGSSSFSSDGKEMYFTKNRDKLNSKNVATFLILRTEYQGDKWLTPAPVIDQNPEYNYVHPSISPNGRLLAFAGDMGGSEGLDLYLCERNSSDENWSKPKKLPEYINSMKDEVFPVFLSDSVLVFSLESPAGLGGLDMFTTRFTQGIWSYPVNLGKPFNSSYDDYGIISDDLFSQGYFTSTRDNDQGIDNIYAFRKKPEVYKDVTITIIDSISGLPIQGVSVVYLRDDSPGIFYVSDSLGKIHFPAEKFKNAGVVIAYKGSLLQTIKFDDLLNQEGDILNIPIVYNSKNFILTGTTINEEGKAIPEVELSFINKSTKDSKKVTSDETGEFEVSTSPDSDYLVTAKKDGHFAPVKEVSTKDFDRNKQLKIEADIKIDKAVDKKVFQLKHIYYDYNKWEIRKDASLELDNLVSFLNENPDINISLGSHTDARGKDDYNLRLSQRRAESVLAYLFDKGIHFSRITAKGYGESMPVNKCINGQSCTEEEHQANRRTEIKIEKPQ